MKEHLFNELVTQTDDKVDSSWPLVIHIFIVFLSFQRVGQIYLIFPNFQLVFWDSFKPEEKIKQFHSDKNIFSLHLLFGIWWNNETNQDGFMATSNLN